MRDEAALSQVSSGGAARALGESVLACGGVVFGCAYRDGRNHHVRVDTPDGLAALSGSKYVWSDVGLTFREVRDCLREAQEYPVLFIGTPCQVAGLRSFLGELAQSERFYAVDLICHGVPAPSVLEEFLRETEGDVPERLSCRDRQGIGLHGRLANGREFHYTGGFACNDYLQAYIYGLTYRERCYSCRYAQSRRVGDITLGDYWGIDRRFLPPDAGELLNILLVNTAQGERLLELARERVALHPVPVEAAVAGKSNLQHPQRRPPERDFFLRKVHSDGVAGALRAAVRRQRRRLGREAALHGATEWVKGLLGLFRREPPPGTAPKTAQEPAKLRILLGGVPLGCDNVGDEAIVGSVVKLLRSILPECELTVSTRRLEETAARLKVRTVPLYGFEPQLDLAGFAEEVRRHDIYIWFGATGLSDYPEYAVRLLRIAQRAGVRTIVWGVGMNSELNPAFYRVGGKRLRLLQALGRCMFGLADWVRIYERWLDARTRRHVRKALAKCDLVVLRDAESKAEVERCGYRPALVGADTAILQESAPQPPLPVDESAVRVGFCISEQGALRQLDKMVELWKWLLERPNTRIVLIPMNPVTDKKLMQRLASQVAAPGRIECLEDDAPAVVQACAAQCRVIVSSRLHLLILAANVGVPVIGIERGSKISNWLRQFGQEPAGTVEACDFAAIRRRLEAILAVPSDRCRAEIQSVMAKLHLRLEEATTLLRERLSTIVQEK